VGRLVVTGQLPFSPRCFLAAGGACGAVPDGSPSTRKGKGREIPGGNKRGTSAGRTFPGLQAPTKEGLEGVERARTIRRTAARKRRRHTRARGSGALRRCPLAPTAGREADVLMGCEPWRTPFSRATDNSTTGAAPAAAGGRCRAPVPGEWRSAAGDHQHKPATTADRPR
jgi:hypothetical protein